MSDTPAILRPGALTPAWFNQVLKRNGIDAVVRDFTAKNVGTGQIGESVRFVFDYARSAPDAPASLVGKFPSPNDESRNTGIALGNYIREVNFYKHLAPTALISTPKCWFTDVDPATSEFVLLMDDLAPAEQGDQLKGVSLDQARTVLREAAKLHASHWNDGAIDAYPWVTGTVAAGKQELGDQVVVLWQAFLARYGDRVTAEARKVGDALAPAYAKYRDQYHGPRALAHNDYRPDNMMFATDAGGVAVTVLDWQSVSFGAAASDVAYFLGGAFPAELRRAHETELVEGYYRELLTLGVTDYPLADLWRDYASHTFTLFLTAFFASVIVTQTPRGDDMFFAMLNGAVDQIGDHDSLRYLR